RADRPIGFWRKMQELAVRSGASLLLAEAAREDALLIAADPRFVVAPDATMAEAAATLQARCPLAESIPAERMTASPGAIRWRDPVYERDFWSLPADGAQSLTATIQCARESGAYRLDIYAGLEEPPRETDTLCRLVLQTAEGEPLVTATFRGDYFGGTRWAILSASFHLEESNCPLAVTLANTGFSGLRVQRAELRKWSGPAADA
ncbi:MAG: hypothetical protein IT170_09945, partial [Bryobacterales bacterium]|nr:hypothetical protein [Bryobacterales bacterium]